MLIASESKTLTPWSSEGLDQCRVPLASSLLNIPESSSNIEPSSPLTPSLFPEYFPGTIHFPLHNENCKGNNYYICPMKHVIVYMYVIQWHEFFYFPRDVYKLGSLLWTCIHAHEYSEVHM